MFPRAGSHVFLFDDLVEDVSHHFFSLVSTLFDVLSIDAIGVCDLPFPETFGEVEIVITVVFLTHALGFIIGDSFSFQGSRKNFAKVFAVHYTFSRGCDFIFFVSHA